MTWSKGEGDAGQIQVTGEIEIAESDLVIGTLDEWPCQAVAKFTVGMGKGYVPE